MTTNKGASSRVEALAERKPSIDSGLFANGRVIAIDDKPQRVTRQHRSSDRSRNGGWEAHLFRPSPGSDEANVVRALISLFASSALRLSIGETGYGVTELLKEHPGTLIFSDQCLAGRDRIPLLNRVRNEWRAVSRLLISRCQDMDSAIDASNHDGQTPIPASPWFDDELIALVRDALERTALAREKVLLEDLIGRCDREITAFSNSLNALIKLHAEQGHEGHAPPPRRAQLHGAQGGQLPPFPSHDEPSRSRRLAQRASRMFDFTGLFASRKLVTKGST